ncbi:unnamed protein product, partial [Adineta steineri]
KQQQQQVPQVPLQVHPRRHRLQQLRLAQVRVHQQAALQVVQAQVHQLVPLQPVQVHQQALLQLVQALLQQALQLALPRQHVTTTTTTAYNSCNNLRWNQTGQIVAGTTSGSNADQLKNPSSFYIDNNNTLYICDHDNHRIQKWVQGASTGTTVAGDSTCHPGTTSTYLKNPTYVTFDENGFMYVADTDNNRVQRFTPGSTTGTTVAGTTSSTTALTDLKQPTAIDIDNNSNLYILDMGNTRLVEWAPNATSGTLLISASSLNNVYDILLLPNSPNQIYISDKGDHAVYLWTFGASGPSQTFQAVNDSQHNTLNNAMGIVLDPYGNLYVADSDRDRIVMYCANSTVGIVVAQNNNSVPSLKSPVALAFDSDLNLYMLSTGSDQVVKLPRI